MTAAMYNPDVAPDPRADFRVAAAVAVAVGIDAMMHR